jgi:hypothetical protein
VSESIDLKNLANQRSLGKRSLKRLLTWLWRTPILCLHVRVTPPAILFTVVTFYIDTVNRGSLWSPTHLLRELREVIQPLIAYSNTTPTIVRIPRIILVVAALFHVSPACVSLIEALAPAVFRTNVGGAER